MHIHVLGIGGTFMAALACIARELGHEVEGSDAGVYPPMSEVLESAGIPVHEGYRAERLRPAPDRIVVGNALTRGNPAVEYMLDSGIDYESGPSWLARHALRGRHVIAVAGTHGKTTVASLVAWILARAGRKPGWLVGGMAPGLGTPGRLGAGPHFVIEADEYDTAFFDKRSKFVHYRPRTLVINNLEYDHADIFDDLAAIERQFHHLVRTMPSSGCIVSGGPEADRVLAMGCWTPVVRLGEAAGNGLSVRALEPDGSRFEVRTAEAGHERRFEVAWKLAGAHNLHNAAAALAAARRGRRGRRGRGGRSGPLRRSPAAPRGRRGRGRGHRIRRLRPITRPRFGPPSRRCAPGRRAPDGSWRSSSRAPTPCAPASTATPSPPASRPRTKCSRSIRGASSGRSRRRSVRAPGFART